MATVTQALEPGQPKSDKKKGPPPTRLLFNPSLGENTFNIRGTRADTSNLYKSATIIRMKI